MLFLKIHLTPSKWNRAPASTAMLPVLETAFTPLLSVVLRKVPRPSPAPGGLGSRASFPRGSRGCRLPGAGPELRADSPLCQGPLRPPAGILSPPHAPLPSDRAVPLKTQSASEQPLAQSTGVCTHSTRTHHGAHTDHTQTSHRLTHTPHDTHTLTTHAVLHPTYFMPCFISICFSISSQLPLESLP